MNCNWFSFKRPDSDTNTDAGVSDLLQAFKVCFKLRSYVHIRAGGTKVIISHELFFMNENLRLFFT